MRSILFWCSPCHRKFPGGVRILESPEFAINTFLTDMAIPSEIGCEVAVAYQSCQYFVANSVPLGDCSCQLAECPQWSRPSDASDMWTCRYTWGPCFWSLPQLPCLLDVMIIERRCGDFVETWSTVLCAKSQFRSTHFQASPSVSELQAFIPSLLRPFDTHA